MLALPKTQNPGILTIMNTSSNNQTVVRFPPSPTGKLHVGNVRTLLMNYLYARQHGGKIILRVEDTDKERSAPEYEDYMKEALQWLGLDWDEFHRQSERLEIHQRYLQELLDKDLAYWSDEPPTPEQIERAEKEGRELRTKVIRFRNPGQVITFADEVLGEVSTNTADLGDFVIAKDMHTPLYHLTVVVDDHEMGVTHIIRGADHVANTPRQILLQQAIGATRPVYAHLPIIIGADKKKLGKRHGALPTLGYRDAGYLPQALTNFLAFIGWNPGDEREVFTLEKLIKEFSLDRVQKSPAVFNEEKLQWLNRQHLEMLSNNEFLVAADEFLVPMRALPGFDEGVLERALPVIRERIQMLGELAEMAKAGEYSYYFARPEIDAEQLIWKQDSLDDAKRHLAKVVEILESSDLENFAEADAVKSLIWPYADEVGRGNVLWPLRYSLSGRKKSPDPFTLISVLGVTEAIERIKAVVN